MSSVTLVGSPRPLLGCSTLLMLPAYWGIAPGLQGPHLGMLGPLHPQRSPPLEGRVGWPLPGAEQGGLRLQSGRCSAGALSPRVP